MVKRKAKKKTTKRVKRFKKINPRVKKDTVVVNFLEKKKDYTDKFFDVLEKNTTKEFKENKYGELVVKLKGKKELAKQFGVTTATITKWQKTGIDQKKITKKQRETLNKLHRKFPKFKKETKQFTRENFTRENFFRKKKLPRRKKRQQFYFRVGLFLKFKNGYTIKNLPLSHYDFEGYPQGYERMWSIIKEEINKPHKESSTLVYFTINYFDVTLIDL